MASLIGEVEVTAPEEEDDQVEVLRSITAAQLQDARGTEEHSEVIAEEAATIHYLFYTLTLMKCVLTEKERCLHQARVLDHLSAAMWKRGVPSQIVQEMRDTQEPMVRRAKETVRHQSQRAINRAFRILLSHGEELQRAEVGDGSSTKGQSQIEE